MHQYQNLGSGALADIQAAKEKLKNDIPISEIQIIINKYLPKQMVMVSQEIYDMLMRSKLLTEKQHEISYVATPADETAISIKP